MTQPNFYPIFAQANFFFFFIINSFIGIVLIYANWISIDMYDWFMILVNWAILYNNVYLDWWNLYAIWKWLLRLMRIMLSYGHISRLIC